MDKGQPDDFRVLTAKDTMNLKQQALDLVATLGYISSSLSFSIGGLGILSIMILLVRARRLEIGIRRAVGARRDDIIRQFLIESGMMATVGGAAIDFMTPDERSEFHRHQKQRQPQGIHFPAHRRKRAKAWIPLGACLYDRLRLLPLLEPAQPQDQLYYCSRPWQKRGCCFS